MEAKISTKQGHLAPLPLSPTSAFQMVSFVAEDQFKGVVALYDDHDHSDEDQNCLCSDVFKEIDVVNYANLFDYEHCQAHQASKKKESSSQGILVGVKSKGVSQPQDCSIHDDDAVVSKSMKVRSVSFAPSCQLIQLDDNQTEGLEHALWYSRHDFMLFEDDACLCSQMIQQSETQGTFDGEIGHILGLEKIILCDSYFDRREALREAVMDEQAIQQIAKEVRLRQGYGCGQESEEICLMQLANASERYSLWARERASMAALTLEHDLATKNS